MPGLALTGAWLLWSYAPMIRALFILLCFLVLIPGISAVAQTPANPDAPAPAPAPPAPPPPAGISADQARTALDVLNDPAKRAAFAATLGAIVKAQPTQAGAPAAQGKSAGPAVPETKVEGISIPLAPDSLGAQVLVSASQFVNKIGDEALDALDTVQSLPLLYGWAVVMATNPVARDLLADVAWRAALALACAAAVEYALRWALRRPIRKLEALAPAKAPDEPDEAAAPPPEEEGEAVARAEAGDIEAPIADRPKPSAWVFLRRVPLVIGRLLLELVPVMAIAVTGHLFAASGLGGQTVSRLIILAVIDSYAVCEAILSVTRMLLSPGASRLRLFHLRDDTAAYLMRWTRRLVLIAVFGYAIGEVGLLLGLSDVSHDLLQKSVGTGAAHLPGRDHRAEAAGRAPMAARARRGDRSDRQGAQPSGGDLALDRPVRGGLGLACLRGRVAAWLCRGAALLHRHRAGAHRRPHHAAGSARRG